MHLLEMMISSQEAAMQAADGNIQQLSSICDELLTTKAHRTQELQSISDLLNGIKQLQAAQQDDLQAGQLGSGDGTGQLTSAVAEAQLQQLQRNMLLQSPRQSTACMQVATGCTDAMRKGPQPLNRTGSATTAGDAKERRFSTAQSLHARTTDQDAHLQQVNSWPQAALLQLLQEASGSDSSKDDTVSGSSCCSSAPSSPRSADLVATAVTQHNDTDETTASTYGNSVLQQQQQQQQEHVTSRFAFPATEAANTQKYVTPLKIPHPARRLRRSRLSCISVSSDNDSSSSSGRGSYIGSFHRRSSRRSSDPQAEAPDAAVSSPGVAGNSSTAQAVSQPIAGLPHLDTTLAHSAPASGQHAGPLASTSLSSEAAALMLVLRSAAQQREAAGRMLQARSSVADRNVLHSSLVASPPAQDSTKRIGADVHGNQEHSLAELSTEDSSSPEADTGADKMWQRQQQQQQQRAPWQQPQQRLHPPPTQQHYRHQQRQLELSALAPSSEQQSALVPSTIRSGSSGNISSSNSVRRSHRVAAEQLLHDALESSSFSSLMALVDGQSGEEAEVGMRQPSGQLNAAQHETEVLLCQPGQDVHAFDPQQRQQQQTQQQRHQSSLFHLQASRLSRENTWGSSASTPVPGDRTSWRVRGPVSSEDGSTRSTDIQQQPSRNFASENVRESQVAEGQCKQQQLQQQQVTQQHACQQLPGNLQQHAWQHQQPLHHHHHHQHQQQQLQHQEPQQQLWQQQQQLHQPWQHPAWQPSRHQFLHLSASSIISHSAAASELEADALSVELEQLSQQVEEERQRLLDLQQQRQQLEQELAASAQQRLVQRANTADQTAANGEVSHSSAATATEPALVQGQLAAERAGGAAGASQPLVADIGIQTDAATCEGVADQRGTSCADAACQALLLSTSLPAVGPPAPCRVCPNVQQQLKQLQDTLDKAQEQEKQAQLAAEQSCHDTISAQSQVALARQKLRQAIAAAAKPLAMSGWEDLIEEAAAELEGLEGRVTAAAQRLVELKAGAASAAEAMVTAQREAQRQQAAAAAAALRTEELQQDAEGLVVAISSNEQTKAAGNQHLSELKLQLTAQQAALKTATDQTQAMHNQLQALQEQLAKTEQQLAERERSRQQVVAEVADRQHALLMTRGECASAQDKLSQLQTALVDARLQLETVQQQKAQHQHQLEDCTRQLATLQAQHAAAAAEAAGAQQELHRVLMELEQCQLGVQASELQQAELEEATAAQQQQEQQHTKAAEEAAAKRQQLEAEAAEAQQQLNKVKQQLQAARDEADLCNRAAAVADRQLMQVQQALAAMQAGTPCPGMQTTAPGGHSSQTAATAVAAAAAAHLAESAQLQVKLAAADSRRQMAEERAEEAERKVQQLRTELAGLKDQHNIAERQLRQAAGKTEKLKEKLKEKVEELAKAQVQMTYMQRQLQEVQLQQQQMQRSQPATDSAGITTAQNCAIPGSISGTLPCHNQLQQQQHPTRGSGMALEQEAQQLLASYQQRLRELDSEATTTRSRLQEAEEHLQQQRQLNSSLQQQLTSTQQQLVQVQQQLLELPRQIPCGSAHAAENMQAAVRDSIQGFQEVLQAQSKMQHAQQQADAAKQQVKELQQEYKQLQKKLAGYKQQLTEARAALHQHQQQVVTSSNTADAAAAGAASDSPSKETAALAAPATIEQLQQQLGKMRSELTASQGQLSSSQQNLEWSQREAEHLRQLLHQQQEISNQLKVEVQRLQQQASFAAAAAGRDSKLHQGTSRDRELIDACVQTHEQVQGSQQLLLALQVECGAAKQQLLQATADCAQAKQQVEQLQRQLQTVEQEHKQQAMLVKQLQQQLICSQGELECKEQQLQLQQAQHERQETEWQHRMQESAHRISQELCGCKADLCASKATLLQLQEAAAALEQQLATALSNMDSEQQSNGDDFAAAAAAAAAAGIKPNQVCTHGQPPRACIAEAATDTTGCQELMAKAAKHAQQLAAVYVTVKQAAVQLQQQRETHRGQMQHVVAAVEKSEARRQEAELQVLQLQQECSFLCLQLQQQQQRKLVEQGPMPYRTSMSSVLQVMEQLHAASRQQAAGAAQAGVGYWGYSGVAAVDRLSPTVLAQPGSTHTPLATPHMSLETLGGLAPPTSCLSPQIGVPGSCAQSAAATGTGSVVDRATAACKDLGQGSPLGSAAVTMGAGFEIAQLRQRLIRLSQEMMAHLPLSQQQLLHTQRQQQSFLQQPGFQPCRQERTGFLHGLTPDTPATASDPGSYGTSGKTPDYSSVTSGSKTDNSSCTERAPAAPAAGQEALGVPSSAGPALNADAALQKNLEWLQQQAAGHDRLMQHMRQMWQQASSLAQHCMLLEAAAAADEQLCQHLRTSCQQGRQQQQQQQQSSLLVQRQQDAKDHAGQPGSKDQHKAGQYSQHRLQRKHSKAHRGHHEVHASFSPELTASAEVLLQMAQQLKQDVESLANHNKQLLEAAKQLCKCFRSGVRTVRVRSLALKLELQQHGVPKAGDCEPEQQQNLDAAAKATAVLPTVVAESVVQHWNEIEIRLAQLHQSTEALLQLQLPQPQPHCSRPQQEVGRVAAGSSCDGSSSVSLRSRALRTCNKLVVGVQQLVTACKQQQQKKHGQGAAASQHSPSAKVATLPGQQQRADQPLQHQSSAVERHLSPAPGSNHSSSTGSEGLGTILAALQSRLRVAQHQPVAEHGAFHTQSSGVERSARGRAVTAAGPDVTAKLLCDSSSDSHTEPPKDGCNDSLSTSWLGVQPQRSIETDLQEQQQQQSAASFSHDDVGADVDISESAVIRRAERAALMERLKFLKRQQQLGDQ